MHVALNNHNHLPGSQAHNKAHPYTPRETPSLTQQNKIYYDKSFCEQLVDDQIRTSYFIVYYIKPFVDNMVQLFNCENGEKEQLEYAITPEMRQEVKNCYFMRNKFFFYFCERYCEHFQLTNPTDLFDGDLKELKKVIDYMKVRKDDVLDYPHNNILTDGSSYELNVLEMNWQLVFSENLFFGPTDQEHLLDV